MTIDWWALGFQTVNILVLIWLLQRFFWRPVAAMIAQRVATTQKTIDAAEAKRGEAAAALTDIAKTRAGFAAERQAILDAAHKAAEQEHATSVAAIAAEAATRADAAKAQIAKDAAAVETAWTLQAGKLAVQIASRLLAGLDGPALHTAFLARLVAELKALDPDAREAIAGHGATLEAVSAGPLDPAAQAKVRTALRDALQTQPEIAFKVDSALVAGFELRGAGAKVSNSFQADLDRILLELAHADRH